MSGKSPEECNEIYYVALLHDVGKIGIPEAIIQKKVKSEEKTGEGAENSSDAEVKDSTE